MPGSNGRDTSLQVLHFRRKVEHGPAFLFGCFAQNAQCFFPVPFRQRAGCQQMAADAPLPAGHDSAGLAVPKHMVTFKRAGSQVGFGDGRSQKDPADTATAGMDAGDSQPLRTGQNAVAVERNKVTTGQTIMAVTFFPRLGNTFRIGSGYQCADVIRRNRAVVFRYPDHVTILGGDTRQLVPRAGTAAATGIPQGVDPQIDTSIHPGSQRIFFFQQRRHIGRQGLQTIVFCGQQHLRHAWVTG